MGAAESSLGQALEALPDQREPILAAACADDPALRLEVLSLLASDGAAGDFLEQPAAVCLALSGDGDRPARLPPGHRLGRYEVVSFLGAGAVSEVYRARDSRLGRTVALKLLTDPTAHDAAAWLLREAQHASTLNHPNICTVHEVDEWDGRPFIVTSRASPCTPCGGKARSRRRRWFAVARKSPARSITHTGAAWCTAISRARTSSSRPNST